MLGRQPSAGSKCSHVLMKYKICHLFGICWHCCSSIFYVFAYTGMRVRILWTASLLFASSVLQRKGNEIEFVEVPVFKKHSNCWSQLCWRYWLVKEAVDKLQLWQHHSELPQIECAHRQVRVCWNQRLNPKSCALGAIPWHPVLNTWRHIPPRSKQWVSKRRRTTWVLEYQVSPSCCKI